MKSKLKKIKAVIKAEKWKTNPDDEAEEEEKEEEKPEKPKRHQITAWKEEEKAMKKLEKEGNPTLKRFGLPPKKEQKVLEDPHLKGRSPV